MRKHITYTEEVAGVTCSITQEAIEASFLKARVGDKLVCAYLVQDEDYEEESNGILLSFNRHSKDCAVGLSVVGRTSDGDKDLDAIFEKHGEEVIRRYVAAVLSMHTPEDIVERFEADLTDKPKKQAKALLLEDIEDNCWCSVEFSDFMSGVLEMMWGDSRYFPGDKDAITLDVYSHSGEYWSMSGEGMDCQWDTAHSAGVWVPDADIREQLDIDEKMGKDRKKQVEVYCRQFLEEHNAILSGEVYVCVVDTFDLNGDLEESEFCGGFVGDSAKELLKSDFFDPTCKALRAA